MPTPVHTIEKGKRSRFSNLVNFSGMDIRFDESVLDSFLATEEIDAGRFDSVPILFTSHLKRHGDKLTYGTFGRLLLDDDNYTNRWRTVIVHMGSVVAATESKVDLPTYSLNLNANLNRNASAVLVHELLHLRQDEREERGILAAKKSFLGLGWAAVCLANKINNIGSEIKKFQKEEEVRIQVEQMFSNIGSLDNLVRVTSP